MIAWFCRWRERQFRQSIDLGRIESIGIMTTHRVHQRIKNLFYSKDFFFTDAQEVVVIGRPLDDRRGGVFEAGCFIDNHRRITWSGDDRLLAALHRSPGYGRSTSHAQQSNTTMSEDCRRSLKRWLFDNRDQIFQTSRLVDRPVKAANPFAGNPGTTRVRIHDHRVSSGDHVHNVSGQCRQRMRHWGDCADDTKRSVFGDRQPVVTADGIRPHELDTWHKLDDLELFDLMIESTDLGLFKFQPT